MVIKIKKLSPDAKIPSKSREGDAAYDLSSGEDYLLKPGERHLFKLGFALEIKEGFVALIWDRSGTAANYGLHALAGVVDPNYRGEVGVVLLNTSSQEYQVKKGDRIAQLLIQKTEEVEFEEVAELAESTRGEQGWLSSGR